MKLVKFCLVLLCVFLYLYNSFHQIFVICNRILWFPTFIPMNFLRSSIFQYNRRLTLRDLAKKILDRILKSFKFQKNLACNQSDSLHRSMLSPVFLRSISSIFTDPSSCKMIFYMSLELLKTIELSKYLWQPSQKDCKVWLIPKALQHFLWQNPSTLEPKLYWYNLYFEDYML